jgi:glutamate dehydrogenase
MTVKPDSQSVGGSGEWEKFAPGLMRSYVESYRGPQGDAPAIGDSGLTAPVRVRASQVLTSAVLAAHGELGLTRKPGGINVAIYADDERGFGPALQLVTDEAPMVMESVTVLLNRLGVPYVSIMSPVFVVRRGRDGALDDIRPTSDRDR